MSHFTVILFSFWHFVKTCCFCSLARKIKFKKKKFLGKEREKRKRSLDSFLNRILLLFVCFLVYWGGWWWLPPHPSLKAFFILGLFLFLFYSWVPLKLGLGLVVFYFLSMVVVVVVVIELLAFPIK
jgi:hypothetical protein